jgi:hypothetical protein
MRNHEWNSLFLLVEREQGERKEENCPLRDSKMFPRHSSHPYYIKVVLVAGSSDLTFPKGL